MSRFIGHSSAKNTARRQTRTDALRRAPWPSASSRARESAVVLMVQAHSPTITTTSGCQVVGRVQHPFQGSTVYNYVRHERWSHLARGSGKAERIGTQVDHARHLFPVRIIESSEIVTAVVSNCDQTFHAMVCAKEIRNFINRKFPFFTRVLYFLFIYLRPSFVFSLYLSFLANTFHIKLHAFKKSQNKSVI